jgi:hypothetical protein
MSTLKKVFAFSTLWLLLVATIGCAKSNRAGVNGQVTLDGKAVEDGTISFLPNDNPGLAACSEIKAGSYSIPIKTGPGLGTNRVEIRWTRKSNRPLPDNPAVFETEEAIPVSYNNQSELKVDVKPGMNQFDFTLDTRAKGSFRRQ